MNKFNTTPAPAVRFAVLVTDDELMKALVARHKEIEKTGLRTSITAVACSLMRRELGLTEQPKAS